MPQAEQRSRDQIREILGRREIKHAVVLGANGTMGFGSGALLTSAIPRVTFLARTKEKAEEGLAAAVKQVRSPTVATKVDCGSYDGDLARVCGEADLIFEAVTERLDLKREFFERIDAARRPDSIVATVTSGLSINQLAEGRSESFRRNFLGLHFFNPPNVIVGTELVPGEETDEGLAEFMEIFAEKRLGRVMIRTADTPGFAGNRVGFKVLNEAAQLAEAHGPLLIDQLIGPHTGRALSPLATVDLVGWDIHRAIVDNIAEKVEDEAHATLRLPDYMAKLIEGGTLGRKSGKGFFARDGKRKLALDPKTGDYAPCDEIALPDLGYIGEVAQLHRMGRYRDAMVAFVSADGEYAAIAQRVIAGYVSYAFHRVGEATESITGIDKIMGFGFNWAPPSVLVDTMGLKTTVELMTRHDVPVPKLLSEALSAGRTEPFYFDPRGAGRFFVAA